MSDIGYSEKIATVSPSLKNSRSCSTTNGTVRSEGKGACIWLVSPGPTPSYRPIRPACPTDRADTFTQSDSRGLAGLREPSIIIFGPDYFLMFV